MANLEIAPGSGLSGLRGRCQYTLTDGPVLRQSAPLLLILLLGGAAFLWPAWFTPLQAGIVPGLCLIMFGMGLSLDAEQVRLVLRNPRWMLVGVVLQFTVMPLVAWALSRAAAFPPELTAGMVLTGASPGGTASNVLVYLSGGNLALSVAMTSLSTLLAPLATPLLTLLLAGREIDIPVARMVLDVLRIVIVPVILGMLARRLAPGFTRDARRFLPVLSLTIVALIVATIVALNHDNLLQLGLLISLMVMLHNAAGLLFGYIGARVLGAQPVECRTIALEVGMQNSGLASALAIAYFPPAASLPAALFSVWHNLSGLFLCYWWRGRDRRST